MNEVSASTCGSASVSVWIALAAFACASPRTATDQPSARAAPSSAAAHSTATLGAAPAPSGSAATAPPTPLQLSFEMERKATSSTLWLIIAGRPKVKLRDVEEPFTCDMTEKEPQPYDHCSWSIGCKPGDAPICVRREGAELQFVTYAQQPQDRLLAQVTLAAGQTFELDERIRGNSQQGDCPVDAPKVIVDARLLLRNSPTSGRTSWFEVPSLGLGFEALGLITPTACDTERVRSRVSFYCMSAESSFTFNATAKDGVLSMRETSTSYDGDWNRSLGAIKLPCGAQLKWQKLRVRDRAWSGVGMGQCGQACQERHADCADRCRTGHPADYHDNGDPARDQGEDCLAECQLTLNACPCGQFQ